MRYSDHEQRQMDIASGKDLDRHAERRAKLRAKIAEQDAARGRPLTATEKLNNLEDALGMNRGALRQKPQS